MKNMMIKNNYNYNNNYNFININIYCNYIKLY